MTEETVVVATSTLTVPLVEPLQGEDVDFIHPDRLVADRNNATFHFLLEPAEEFQDLNAYVDNIKEALQPMNGAVSILREEEGQLRFYLLFGYEKRYERNFLDFSFHRANGDDLQSRLSCTITCIVWEEWHKMTAENIQRQELPCPSEVGQKFKAWMNKNTYFFEQEGEGVFGSGTQKLLKEQEIWISDQRRIERQRRLSAGGNANWPRDRLRLKNFFYMKHTLMYALIPYEDWGTLPKAEESPPGTTVDGDRLYYTTYRLRRVDVVDLDVDD